jgi:ABC-type sugar transport system ATPase subunit
VDGPLATISGVTKTYGSVVALDDVSLEVFPGEVLGLVGKNGAGKSTLMRQIAGLEQADSGSVAGPAPDAGSVALVPQELIDLPSLSVAENLGLPVGLPRRGPFVDWRELRARAGQVLQRVGLEAVDPSTRVEELAVAQRRLLMLGRALFGDARLFLLDEPSEGLGEAERAVLLDVVAQLRRSGAGVIYSSHRLAEVMTVIDRVCIMRDARVIALRQRSEITRSGMVEEIIGAVRLPQRKDVPPAKRDRRLGETLLDFREDEADGAAPVTICRGDIVGVVGLVGSGRTRFVKRLLAEYESAPGHRSGMLIPENRQDGVFRDFSVGENLTICALDQCRVAAAVPWTSRRRETRFAQTWIDRLGIKAPGPGVNALTLSGGNQQKVLLARAVVAERDLIVLDEPSVGLDVAAKQDLFNLVRQLAAEGRAIVIVDSDLQELLEVAERLLVVWRGVAVDALDNDDCSEADLLEKCFAHATDHTMKGSD